MANTTKAIHMRLLKLESKPVRDKANQVVCYPVSMESIDNWKATVGRYTKLDEGIYSDAFSYKSSVHYTDEKLLALWLKKQSPVKPHVYRVITKKEFDEISAQLQAMC